MKLIFNTFFIAMVSFLYSFESVDLKEYEKKIYSQNGEDGILQKIFATIPPTSHFYVEFGVENGTECNTRYLREKQGWIGLMMDGRFENPEIGLHKHFVTRENIVELFKDHEVPVEFDLLSVDVDGNDWYLWEAILQKYSPRVVVIEYNPNFLPSEDMVICYDPTFFWGKINHGAYHGASARALFNLARYYHYSLVYIEKNGVNMFFIRDDVLESAGANFIHINNLEDLFKHRLYEQNIEDVYMFKWESSRELLSSCRDELVIGE